MIENDFQLENTRSRQADLQEHPGSASIRADHESISAELTPTRSQLNKYQPTSTRAPDFHRVHPDGITIAATNRHQLTLLISIGLAPMGSQLSSYQPTSTHAPDFHRVHPDGITIEQLPTDINSRS